MKLPWHTRFLMACCCGMGVWVACGVQGCRDAQSTQSPSAAVQADTIIRDSKRLKGQYGKVLTIEGIYRWHDPRYLRPRQKPRYVGHVVIELSDGRAVHLLPPGDSAAIRPKEELDRLKGKKVRVTCEVAPLIPGSLGHAHTGTPCITSIY